jgi:hypothetical protein
LLLVAGHYHQGGEDQIGSLRRRGDHPEWDERLGLRRLRGFVDEECVPVQPLVGMGGKLEGMKPTPEAVLNRVQV